MIPGEIVYGDGPVEINAGRPVRTLDVVNTGDRPVQVGSHYHFAEANPALEFDRAGLRFKVHVPDQVNFKLEIEIKDDERELEVELKW